MKRLAAYARSPAALLLALRRPPAAAQNGSAEPGRPGVRQPAAEPDAADARRRRRTPPPGHDAGAGHGRAGPAGRRRAAGPGRRRQRRSTIQPDVAYPNGFADPADPFANDLAPPTATARASPGACSACSACSA